MVTAAMVPPHTPTPTPTHHHHPHTHLRTHPLTHPPTHHLAACPAGSATPRELGSGAEEDSSGFSAGASDAGAPDGNAVSIQASLAPALRLLPHVFACFTSLVACLLQPALLCFALCAALFERTWPRGAWYGWRQRGTLQAGRLWCACVQAVGPAAVPPPPSTWAWTAGGAAPRRGRPACGTTTYSDQLLGAFPRAGPAGDAVLRHGHPGCGHQRRNLPGR